MVRKLTPLKKTGCFAQNTDEQTGNRWPHETITVEHNRVQGNRVCQIILVYHEVNNEGLPGGNIQGIYHAQKNTEDDEMPDGYMTGEREKGKNERLEHGKNLCQHKKLSAIMPISKNSCY
jgi:hypothetical protein